MMEPGFTPGGSASHAVRVPGVLGSIPPAMVVREPTWVRSGPTTPADTPVMVWQPTQAPVVKARSPAAAGLPSAGVAAGARCRATQASNSAGASTTASIRMLAWDAPQNSAHCP
ncbi:MAG: hypothetical protein DMD79_16015 [Candidatus Rokuibacteriota bacterium]|nr:MAG: hypothetical protein DMD79_16015 [Candidatus Rokubacteria bacterium]